MLLEIGSETARRHTRWRGWGRVVRLCLVIVVGEDGLVLRSEEVFASVSVELGHKPSEEQKEERCGNDEREEEEVVPEEDVRRTDMTPSRQYAAARDRKTRVRGSTSPHCFLDDLASKSICAANTT